MKIDNLIFIACLAIVQSITTNEIAFPIGLVGNTDTDFSDVSQTQEEEQAVDVSSLTTMEVICNCNDGSCVAKSETIIEEEPVRGLW